MFLTELGICCHFWHFHLLDSITGTIYTIDMLDFLPNVEKITSRYDTVVHVCLRHGAGLSATVLEHLCTVQTSPSCRMRTSVLAIYLSAMKKSHQGYNTVVHVCLRHGAGISATLLDHLRHSADISKLPNVHLRYGDLSLCHDLSDVSPKVLHSRACVCAIRL